jgi:hypothetical protein
VQVVYVVNELSALRLDHHFVGEVVQLPHEDREEGIDPVDSLVVDEQVSEFAVSIALRPLTERGSWPDRGRRRGEVVDLVSGCRATAKVWRKYHI